MWHCTAVLLVHRGKSHLCEHCKCEAQKASREHAASGVVAELSDHLDQLSPIKGFACRSTNTQRQIEAQYVVYYRSLHARLRLFVLRTNNAHSDATCIYVKANILSTSRSQSCQRYNSLTLKKRSKSQSNFSCEFSSCENAPQPASHRI